MPYTLQQHNIVSVKLVYNNDDNDDDNILLDLKQQLQRDELYDRKTWKESATSRAATYIHTYIHTYTTLQPVPRVT